MRATYMKRQGYNYYVYAGPGSISYFEKYKDAKEYADRIGAAVEKMF